MSSPTVLLIGASGRLGLQLIRSASTAASPISIHAFCRTPSKLPPSETSLCASVVRGDARIPADLERALRDTRSDTVIMAVGVPDSVAKSDVRHMTAKALMDVIKPGSQYQHVKVVVVSSTGAGGTKIDVGMGIGMVLAFVLRHVMRDHDNQESEFKSRIGDQGRLLIVRPTALTDGKSTGRVVTFEKDAKGPTSRTDRADLAKWIVEQICGGSKAFGKEVSITGRKR